MTWEAWLTLIVVTETIAVLVTERISPTFVVLGPVVVLLVTGVCVRHGHAGGTRTARLCDRGGHRSVRLFLSPIGYQTNTMVYGMGGYRFTDFSRLGLPLTIVVTVFAAIFIPLSWPLT